MGKWAVIYSSVTKYEDQEAIATNGMPMSSACRRTRRRTSRAMTWWHSATGSASGSRIP